MWFSIRFFWMFLSLLFWAMYKNTDVWIKNKYNKYDNIHK